MGETASPLVKSEPSLPLLYQPYPYQPSFPNITVDDTSSSSIKPHISSGPSPSHIEADATLQQRAKKQKTSSTRAGPGRGAMTALGHGFPADEITYTPITHRISKAKKGKKVHGCTFPGCPKIFTRAEHRRRHEANHNAHPAFQCHLDGCKKPFQRADLLARHMERQHNIPMDASSSRSARSTSGTCSPVRDTLHVPRPTHSSSNSLIAQASSSKATGVFAERQLRDSIYRAQSVPPSLNDHIYAQQLGTVHYNQPTGIAYGLSPPGESHGSSSSDSCHSPPSDYYPHSRSLQQNYNYGQEIVQRPHSALENNYHSLETSPMSVGPPTPVTTSTWNPAFDPNSIYMPESHCMPARHYSNTPPWPAPAGLGFTEIPMTAKAGWH